MLASEGEMKQVVLNLTLNALDATDGDGVGGLATQGLRPSVTIRVSRRDDRVELCVSDTGRGMSRDVLDRIFEPFFTAKRGSARPGTGLGLSICHAIIESHGGRIDAYSDGPGKGSRFIVQLPAIGKGAA